jgi:uncharacterized protein (DUF2384 family)
MITSATRDRIASAARAMHANEAKLIEQLAHLDAEVAKQAVETFDGNAEGAAAWLLSGNHRGLPSGTPVELSQTVGGRKQVLDMPRAIVAGG